MSQVNVELEPRVAARQAIGALLEAARYSGYGLSTVGARTGRRAALAGVEGARRTGGAWLALRGVAPVRPRTADGTVVVALVAGGVAGAVVALAVRRGVVAWRVSDPQEQFGARLRSVLRSAGPGAATESGPVGADTADDPVARPR